MKTQTTILIALGFILQPLAALHAGTTIDTVNRYAYGANIGWVNAVADTNNGAVMGQYVCSGYLYSANVGWINLGSGSPANSIYYQNNSASDFGVNNDGQGNLSGYAWGANIGWITFEQTYGKPKINLLTGTLSGYVWSANCGWISLSNAVAHVQTDYLYPGQLALNGLPISWLLSNFGTTNINVNSDPTGKGMTVGQDYVAGTDPNNVNSVLRITAEGFNSFGTANSLTWLSQPTRLYYILGNTNLLTPTWQGSSLGLILPAAGSTTTAAFTDTKAGAKFYHVQAVVPLSP
jgi:hypothetical protein